ncbi:MAG: cobalamin-dependent protein [Gemmatimonadota bacterium]
MQKPREQVAPSARHPIAVVSERTGLTQDVLRVWERRYAAVTPVRDAGGNRLYSDADVHRLTLLQSATRAGRSIGRLAHLPTRDIEELVREDSVARESRPAPLGAVASPGWAEDVVLTAIGLAQSLDGAAVEETLRRSAANLGIPAFIETIAAPLLRRVGDEWHAGRMTPAQEHLVSSLVHDILTGAMRAVFARPRAPRILVATPAGDRHAIGAALVGAAAAVEGWNVLYLGADLPSADIAAAAAAARVRVVAISVILVEGGRRVLDELASLRARLPNEVELVVGGNGVRAIARELLALNIRVEDSVGGLVAELRRISEGVTG